MEKPQIRYVPIADNKHWTVLLHAGGAITIKDERGRQRGHFRGADTLAIAYANILYTAEVARKEMEAAVLEEIRRKTLPVATTDWFDTAHGQEHLWAMFIPQGGSAAGKVLFKSKTHQGMLLKVKAWCRRHKKPFEFVWANDGKLEKVEP